MTLLLVRSVSSVSCLIHINHTSLTLIITTYFNLSLGISWEKRVGYNTDNLGTMRTTYPYYTHDKFIQYNGTTYDGIGEAKGFAVDVAEESLYAIAELAFTATVHAQRNSISRSTYFDMPLIYLLGDSLTFMLRDIIQYAGNYDDIFNEAFASSDGETEIGWNIIIAVSEVIFQ